jgi:hypothetical protein
MAESLVMTAGRPTEAAATLPDLARPAAASFPKPNMNPYIEPMLQLQRRLQAGAKTEETDKLRAQVPAVVLAHFDRMIAQKRKGVAEVHHGVCGACHLRLPASVVVPSAEHEDLELCENCGAYLSFTAPDAAVEKPAPKPRRRRAVAVV